MHLDLVLTALAWGALAGGLATGAAESVISLGGSLHGLVLGRWRRLAHKAATGVVRPGIILRLIARAALIALLCLFLIRFGHTVARREFGFVFQGSSAVLFTLAACAVAVGRLRSARKRLACDWRMSHEVDYAEKRQRTRLLKS